MKRILIFILWTFTLNADVVVFDVAGVLFETDAAKAAEYHKATGMLELINTNKESSITLRSILLAAKPFDEMHTYIAKDSKGNFLTPLIVDWLTNQISNKELYVAIEKTVAHANCTAPIRERILYEAHCMLNPHFFVFTRSRIMPMIHLLQHLAGEGHTILLCSNWDHPSFELSKQCFPEIFDYVTEAINSCNTQIIKPDPTIFRLIPQKYPLKKGERYVFIDDQEENRVIAEQEGFITAHPDHAEKLFTPLTKSMPTAAVDIKN